MQFFQVYLDQVLDILAPSNQPLKPLSIREDSDYGVHYPGITEVEVNSYEHALSLIKAGQE